MSLRIGEIAPEFELINQDGIPVRRSTLTSVAPTLLAFYPGDFTFVCTKQLCSYQEAFDRFRRYGIVIAGISKNNPESHKTFKKEYNFDFDLLSDPGKETFKKYGVTSLFAFGGTSRAVYILGKDATVLYRYVEPTVLTHRKPDELLEILDNLHQTGRL